MRKYYVEFQVDGKYYLSAEISYWFTKPTVASFKKQVQDDFDTDDVVINLFRKGRR